MSRPRRRSHYGRFEIVGRGFPPCRQGQLASSGDNGVGLPFAYIDGGLMGTRHAAVHDASILPKRMARPVCKRFRDLVWPVCDDVSGLRTIGPGQDGDSRVPVLMNFTASKRHIWDLVSRTPAGGQAISFSPPANIVRFCVSHTLRLFASCKRGSVARKRHLTVFSGPTGFGFGAAALCC